MLLNIVDLAHSFGGARLVVGSAGLAGRSLSVSAAGLSRGLPLRWLFTLLVAWRSKALWLGSSDSSVLFLLDVLVKVPKHDVVVPLWLKVHLSILGIQVLKQSEDFPETQCNS